MTIIEKEKGGSGEIRRIETGKNTKLESKETSKFPRQ